MKPLPSSAPYIDLRGTPCPLNFIRCCLAIEDLSPKDHMDVWLDKGEPEDMVISGLRSQGHHVQIIFEHSDWIRLRVVCGAR